VRRIDWRAKRLDHFGDFHISMRREGKVSRPGQPFYQANFESFPASPERMR